MHLRFPPLIYLLAILFSLLVTSASAIPSPTTPPILITDHISSNNNDNDNGNSNNSSSSHGRNGVVNDTTTTTVSTKQRQSIHFDVKGTDVAIEIHPGGPVKDPSKIIAFFYEQREKFKSIVRSARHDFPLARAGRDPYEVTETVGGQGAEKRERMFFFAQSPMFRRGALTWQTLADACEGIHDVLALAHRPTVPVNTNVYNKTLGRSVGLVTFLWEIVGPDADTFSNSSSLSSPSSSSSTPPWLSSPSTCHEDCESIEVY